MRHIFIINPAAGSFDRTEKVSKEIKKLCGQRGLDYEIAVSACPGDCGTRRGAASGSGSGSGFSKELRRGFCHP